MTQPREEQLLDRPLPSSEESERLIIGGILMDNALIGEVIEELNPPDFYSPFCRYIYEAMLELFNSSQSITPILIGEELKKKGLLDKIGGISAITSMLIGMPHFTSLNEYVALVKDKALARRIVRVSNQFITEALSEEAPATEIIDRFESTLFGLTDNNQSSSFAQFNELICESLARVRVIADSGEAIIGLPSGFADIDSRTLGLHNGDLTILAARPSMGKTALALNIAQNAAFRGNALVAFFSLEMSKNQVIERIISSEARINSQRYRTGQLSDEEWTTIEGLQERLVNSLLFVDDTPAISVPYMRARLRRLSHEQRRPDLVVVDYLQLMSADSENRQQEISKISRNLKALAKEFDCPVLSLSQLNRDPEGRASKMPLLADLRESGAIEQDADVVMFILREDYYVPDPSLHTGTAIINIAKQRNGPTGNVTLRFIDSLALFEAMPPPAF